MMKVLIECEYSGIVREAFRKRGHDAWSCDLLPDENESGHHIEGDAKEAITYYDWDLIIAHPPCQFICSSGLHWNKRRPERIKETAKAIDFFMFFANLPFRYAIESSIGRMSTIFREPDQIIQPHEFGHDASKATCLWLNGLPRLKPTKDIKPRMVDGLPRWDNQTDSGQNKEPPSDDRWRIRSRTYQGIADAMAEQWTIAIESNTAYRQLDLF